MTQGNTDSHRKRKQQRSGDGAVNRTTTCVYVPETFDPDALLPAELRQYGDCARYFLHRIVWGLIQKRRTVADYVPLKFQYLREVIPDRVIKPLKQALIEAGVIECDGRYIEGVKAFGYKLLPPYSDARIVRTSMNGETADKVRASRRAESKRIRLDVHRYLRNQLRRLEVDLPRALTLLEGHPHFDLVKIPAEQIAQGDSSFSVCRQGRIHTDLTRSPRAVRSALHVGGEPLVSIDIANSQPLFLGLVLLNYRKAGKKAFSLVNFTKKVSNVYDEIDEIIRKTVKHFEIREESTVTTSYSASITTRKEIAISTENTEHSRLTTTTICPDNKAVNRSFLTGDEASFIAVCEAGKLYETLMNEEQFTTRSQMKEDFFKMVYGKNSFRSSMKSRFTERFPNVANVVRDLKRKDYTFLPCLMQSVEADFVINRVCRRLMAELPEAPVFTIHDSVLTTEQFALRVEEVMTEEFELLGLTPSLHVEMA